MSTTLAFRTDLLPPGAGPDDLARLADGTPPALVRAVNQCLESVGPTLLLWGPDRRVVFNRSYREFSQEPRPHLFGAPLQEAWPRAWEVLGAQLQPVIDSAQTQWIPNRQGRLQRDGRTLEVHYTCHLTPARGDDGTPAGVFVAILDTTAPVQFKRRIGVLRRLGADGLQDTSLGDLYTRLGATLTGAVQDLPFALVYEVPPSATSARLRIAAGLAGSGWSAPPLLDLSATSPWPIGQALRHGTPVLVDDVVTRFPGLSAGEPPEPVEIAFVSCSTPGNARLPGTLSIFGVNPRHALDAEHQRFLFDALSVVARDVEQTATTLLERERAANLQRAMESNRQIGAAIGILMMGHKLTQDQAFDVLSAASQNTNRKLRDIADDVVRTGAMSR